jgi:hypothetical protein
MILCTLLIYWKYYLKPLLSFFSKRPGEIFGLGALSPPLLGVVVLAKGNNPSRRVTAQWHAIYSIANLLLNDDPGTIIAVPDETFGLAN